MTPLTFLRFRRGVRALLVVWVLLSVWLGSDSGVSLPGVLIIVYSAGLLLLAWLLLFVIAWKRKERLKMMRVEPIVAGLVMATIYSGALFQLRFLASKPALDRYVSETLAAGGSHQNPTHVGLFVARETDVLPNGAVRIITAACGFDDCGIVFSRMEPPVIGEDQYGRLGDGWWRWRRNW